MAIPTVGVLLLVALVVLPVVVLVVASLEEQLRPGEITYSLNNYLRAYSNPRTFTTLLTSVLYTVSVCALTLAIAFPVAWIVERTNTPLRKYIYALGLMPLIVPGVLITLAWVLLLDSNIGWINILLQNALGLAEPPLEIYSFGGMVWVQALSSSPLAFLLLSAALKATDPALEESAVLSGASNAQIVRRITLPLMRPAVVGVLLITAVKTLSAFEVPAIIGLPDRIFVLSTQLYGAFSSFPPDYGYGNALAVGLLVVAAIGVWLYARATRHTRQFETVTGKAFRPRIWDLGRFRYVTLSAVLVYLLLLIVLPGITLLWGSLLPYFQVPKLEALGQLSLENYSYVLGDDLTRKAIVNSVMLGVSAATLVVLFTAVIAWITIKSRLPGRRLLDQLAFLPIGVPGLVLGVAMIQMFISFPLPVYGTMFVIIVAYTINYLPYGMRANSTSMMQVHDELEEAAKVSGSSWWHTFRRILVPLIRPGLIAGWIYIFVTSFSEMSTAIMLTSKDNIVVSVAMFFMFSNGRATEVAALGLIMVIATVAIVAVVARLGARFGISV